LVAEEKEEKHLVKEERGRLLEQDTEFVQRCATLSRSFQSSEVMARIAQSQYFTVDQKLWLTLGFSMSSQREML
jgi:hypothetical protein